MQVFCSFGALNSHMYRHHRDALSLSEPGTSEPTSSLDLVSESVQRIEVQDGGDYPASELDFDVSYLLDTDSFEQQKQSAGFLLKLREVRQLSQVATQDVIEGSLLMFNRTISRTKAVVKDALHRNGINYSEVEGLDSALSSISPLYENLETIYKQDVFFRDHFDFLVSRRLYYYVT